MSDRLSQLPIRCRLFGHHWHTDQYQRERTCYRCPVVETYRDEFGIYLPAGRRDQTPNPNRLPYRRSA